MLFVCTYRIYSCYFGDLLQLSVMSSDNDLKVVSSLSFPLTRDTDGPCTTECDSGDWSAEVTEENLPVVKQEPDDVCCT